MWSQQTWTLLIVAVAVFVGYRYSIPFSTSTEALLYDGKVTYVSSAQLDPIVYTTIMEKKLKAFVLGATGAVGKELVKVLAADSRFEKVALIGRRPINLNKEENVNYDKFENQVIDFDKLENSKDVFKDYDVGFSSLGTTRKKSGPEGFYKVDHDYVVQTAKLAKEGGCQHLHLVSSTGANKNAYFLYPKTKGEVEEELTEMEFPKLTIYRPALLLVNGGREDARFGEAILQSIARPLDRSRWFSIDVPVLAKVMVANCFRETPSRFEIMDNAALNKFGRQLESGSEISPPPTTGEQRNQ